MLTQRDRAAGEGSRFVTTENVNAAEILHRFQMLDDHLLFGHTQSSLTQGDRRDHGQKLRCQTYCESNGKEDRLEERVMKHDSYEKYEEDQKEDRLENEKSKATDATLKFGFWRVMS